MLQMYCYYDFISASKTCFNTYYSLYGFDFNYIFFEVKVSG